MTIESMITDHGAYLYNFAMKLTCHPQQAEDLAQDTLISAWKHLNQLQKEEAIRAWLRTICLNTYLMEKRKKDSMLELHETIEELESDGKLLVTAIPQPEEEILVAEEIRELQNGCFYAMARKLTLNQRIAFSMVDMFGLSMQETAGILDLTVPAVKGLLYRARMNLDAFFADHCNLIRTGNPCSCKAWLEFSTTKQEHKKAIKQAIEEKEYQQHHYTFDLVVRERVHALYQQIPDKKPPKGWYQTVINALHAEK